METSCNRFWIDLPTTHSFGLQDCLTENPRVSGSQGSEGTYVADTVPILPTGKGNCSVRSNPNPPRSRGQILFQPFQGLIYLSHSLLESLAGLKSADTSHSHISLRCW